MVRKETFEELVLPLAELPWRQERAYLTDHRALLRLSFPDRVLSPFFFFR